jgi:high-affinity nickel-transport protein
MYPLGILFGLGLETASEVTLLTLSATTASAAGVGGSAPLVAALTLPLLFAAGMSAFDTDDGVLMSVAYSWSNRSPAQRLFYNIATTTATVTVAGFIACVYLAGVLSDDFGVSALAGFAGLADEFELLGYLVVGFFVAVWGGAALLWRFGGFEHRHAAPDPRPSVRLDSRPR